jgi:hypothetical protein
VFGDDRLATGYEDESIWITLYFWEFWPEVGMPAPSFSTVLTSMAQAGGQVALERVKTCRQYEDNLWQEGLRVRPGLRRRNSSYLWYMRSAYDLVAQANILTFCSYLVDLPYFDCRWAFDRGDVVNTQAGGSAERTKLAMQIYRPSGIHTLGVYFWQWFNLVVTEGDEKPADDKLHQQLVAEANAAAAGLQDEMTLEQLREAVEEAYANESMIPEITDQQMWWVIEGRAETIIMPQLWSSLEEALRAAVLSEEDARWVVEGDAGVHGYENLDEPPSTLDERAEHLHIYIEEQEGFGGRLQMPGYMDSTDWILFDTEEDALEYFWDDAPVNNE